MREIKVEKSKEIMNELQKERNKERKNWNEKISREKRNIIKIKKLRKEKREKEK